MRLGLDTPTTWLYGTCMTPTQAKTYEELLDALEEALKEPVPRAYARIVRLVREARTDG